MRVNIIPDFTNLFLQLISTIILIAIPVFIIYIILKFKRTSYTMKQDLYSLVESLEKRMDDLEERIDQK